MCLAAFPSFVCRCEEAEKESERRIVPLLPLSPGSNYANDGRKEEAPSYLPFSGILSGKEDVIIFEEERRDTKGLYT